MIEEITRKLKALDVVLAKTTLARIQGDATGDLKELTREILIELQALNLVLNGKPAGASLTRQLLYVVNGLTTLCLDFAVSDSGDDRSREEMLVLAWTITTAWDAVLAGDIADICEHVELEAAARFGNE